MSAEKILTSWKKKDFKPVYWLSGDEDYYIDQLVNYAEHHILTEEESSFNLSILYGRDTDWAQVTNACRRYPMFADKQVVILKEAQYLKDIEKLEPYISAPLASTILIIAYKEKALDKRKTFYKVLQSKAELLITAKLKDDKLPEWIAELVKNKGFNIDGKAIAILQEHIGNDLARIANEVEKLSVNLKDKKSIDADDIEKFIGISKEYNIFELQAAIAKKDFPKAIKIVNYFESNPKAFPIQKTLPALYFTVSKTYGVFGLSDKSDAALKPLFYFNPNAVQQAKDMMKNYGYAGIEKMILLLHHYNLKSIGINNSNTDQGSLMKEMVLKMMM